MYPLTGKQPAGRNGTASPPDAGIRPRICFVAPKAYGLLAGRSNCHVGGAESQQILIARALRDRGYNVSFIVRDEGQGWEVNIDGIHVFATCPPDAGLPGVRFIHPRWTSLRRALRRANADVYYQRVAGLETGQVAQWCRRNRRAFVFAAAADVDCDPLLPALRDPRERWSYRFGLREASRVVTQTRAQQQRLREGFGIDAAVIPSCALPPEATDLPDDPTGKPQLDLEPRLPEGADRRIVWIGRVVPIKRLEWLLDAAARLPEYTFEIVGPWPDRGDYTHELRHRATALPNVRLHGRVSPQQVGILLEHSRLLACTSRIEGFPNTFLEAWARFRPVVTTFDPDGVVRRHELGGVAANLEELAADLRSHMQDDRLWREAALRARAYWDQNHTVEKVAEQYDALLRQCAETQGQERTPLNPRGQSPCVASAEL